MGRLRAECATLQMERDCWRQRSTEVAAAELARERLSANELLEARSELGQCREECRRECQQELRRQEASQARQLGELRQEMRLLQQALRARLAAVESEATERAAWPWPAPLTDASHQGSSPGCAWQERPGAAALLPAGLTGGRAGGLLVEGAVLELCRRLQEEAAALSPELRLALPPPSESAVPPPRGAGFRGSASEGPRLR